MVDLVYEPHKKKVGKSFKAKVKEELMKLTVFFEK